MIDDLAQDAIAHALSGNWEKALLTNQKILEHSPQDVDALNRVARAYAELGNIQKARETMEKAFKLDPFNTIAQKALERWKDMKNGDGTSSGPISSQAFLEEPGKTKIIALMHLGGHETIAEVDSGDEVLFNCHSHRVSVTCINGKYIGRLPDDLSARVKKLTGLGYEYRSFIKSVDKNEVKIFIKETKRPTKLSDIPSFPTEKINYISFTPPELLQEETSSDDGEDMESDGM